MQTRRVCSSMTNAVSYVTSPRAVQTSVVKKSAATSAGQCAWRNVRHAVAEFREAPTLVVVETQPLSLKTDLQHTILFAEKRDHVLVFTLSPGAQHR